MMLDGRTEIKNHFLEILLTNQRQGEYKEILICCSPLFLEESLGVAQNIDFVDSVL